MGFFDQEDTLRIDQGLLKKNKAELGQLLSQPVPPPPQEESGYLLGGLKSLNRGLLGIQEQAGQAMEWNADYQASIPQGQTLGDQSKLSLINKAGKVLKDSAEAGKEWLGTPNAGDNYLKKSTFSALESAPPSLAYKAPGFVGAVLGQTLVPIPGVGAALGAVVGQAPSAAVMYRSAAQEAADGFRKTNPNIDPAKALAAAQKSGHYEWAGEGVSDVVSNVLFSKLPGVQSGFKLAREALVPTAKTFLKNMAVTIPSENLGEGFTTWGQTNAANEIMPAGNQINMKDALLDTLGSTTIMSGILGVGGHTAQAYRGSKIAATLESATADPKARGEAAGQVYGALLAGEKDNLLPAGTSDIFAAKAHDAIGNAEQTGTDPYALNLRDPGLLKPVAPVSVAPTLGTPVTPAEAVVQAKTEGKGALEASLAATNPILGGPTTANMYSDFANNPYGNQGGDTNAQVQEMRGRQEEITPLGGALSMTRPAVNSIQDQQALYADQENQIFNPAVDLTFSQENANDLSGMPKEAVKSQEVSSVRGGNVAPQRPVDDSDMDANIKFETDLENHISKLPEQPFKADSWNGKVVVSQSAKDPGKWQVTRFDDKGPFSDSIHEDYQSAVAVAAEAMPDLNQLPAIASTVPDATPVVESKQGIAVVRGQHAGNGSIVTDKSGNQFMVMNQRNSIVTAVPIVDGKPVVNRDSQVSFNVDPNFQAASDLTRTEPLYHTGTTAQGYEPAISEYYGKPPAPKGAATLAVRQQNARTAFETTLQETAGITPEEATAVTDAYLKNKLATMDAVNGVIKVKHGSYLDPETIRNAARNSALPAIVKPLPQNVPKINETILPHNHVLQKAPGKGSVYNLVNKKTGKTVQTFPSLKDAASSVLEVLEGVKAKQAESAAKRSKAAQDVSRKREEAASHVDPQVDDIVVAIAKRGGISFDQATAQWGPTITDMAKDLHIYVKSKTQVLNKPVIHKGGNPIDMVIRSIIGDGYLQEGAVPNDLFEAIRDKRKATSLIKDMSSEAERLAKEYEESILADLPGDYTDAVNESLSNIEEDGIVDDDDFDVFDAAIAERKANETGNQSKSVEEPGEGTTGAQAPSNASDQENIPVAPPILEAPDAAGLKQESFATGDKKPIEFGTGKPAGNGMGTSDLLDNFADLDTQGDIFNQPAEPMDDFDREWARQSKPQPVQPQPVAPQPEQPKPSFSSAAGHAGKAFESGMAAMKAILKNASNESKLNMLPTFDDKLYAQLKPHLTTMWQEAKAAASDVNAALKEFIGKVISGFGADAEQIKPYAKKFYQEASEEAAPPILDNDPAIDNNDAKLINGDYYGLSLPLDKLPDELMVATKVIGEDGATYQAQIPAKEALTEQDKDIQETKDLLDCVKRH